MFNLRLMITIPTVYTISKFNLFTNKSKTYSNYINGGCPICHEGESWNIKQRLFYYLKEDFLYCYNCARSWNPYWWIREVSGMTHKELQADITDYTGDNFVLQWDDSLKTNDYILPDLPGECVNLTDDIQLKYYKSNKIVSKALDYCKSRRLFSAINAPKTFYVCLNDNFHKNRLIIPFYKNGRIVCYTSRKILNDDSAKYLLKFNSPKTVFNIDKIKPEVPYIFLFEGQIDSMFVENGVAVSGLTLTSQQEEELSAFPLHERIWVLDNIKFEKKEVINKIVGKLKAGDALFLYKNKFEEFKDLNDFCVEKKQDFVDPALIVQYSFTGEKGLLQR